MRELFVLETNAEHYKQNLVKNNPLYIAMNNLLSKTSSNIAGTNVKFNLTRNKQLEISPQSVISKIQKKNNKD